MSKLLALDLSGTVGAARLERGHVPTFQTLKLEGPDLTFKIGRFQAWLFDEYDRDPFDGMAWEGSIKTDTDTVALLELLMGLAGACYAFVGLMREREGIHLAWCKVSVDDAKAELCGAATKVVDGKRKKMDKDDMLYHARRTMNWPVTTHHEADAGAVGLVAYSRLWPKRAA